MIKKVLLAIAVIFPMLAFGQNLKPIGQSLKIGVVDFNSILASHPDTAKAQQELSDAQKRYDEAYNKLGEEMKRLYDEFQNMKEDELPAIRERKARDIQDYQLKLQNFEQSAMQDLQRQQAEKMNPIITKIQQAVETVAKEGNFSLIEVKEPQLILYVADPVVDITSAVKAKLGI